MDGAAGLIFSKDKKQILLIKRRDVPVWDLPCGGRNVNESPEDCVIREVFEETGFNVSVIRLVAIYNNTWKRGNCIHSYICEIVGGEKRVSDESKEVEYHDVLNLPHLKTLFVDQFIEDALKEDKAVIKADLKKIPLSFFVTESLKHPIVALRYFLVYNGIHINT